MATNAFSRRLGVEQGRITPTGITPPAGSFVFVLGEDKAGVAYNLAVGNSVAVKQTATVTGLKLIRFSATLRAPASAPAGTRWVAEWGVDTTIQGSRDFLPGTTATLADAAINVTGMTGDHDLFFRLRFMTTAGVAPEVFAITPAVGPLTGGTSVTISGKGFTGCTSASIGGSALTSFVVVNDTTITGVTTAHAFAADQIVEVVHPTFGSGFLLDAFFFRYPTMTVSGLSPNTGFPGGGGTVLVNGTNFRPEAVVYFDGVAVGTTWVSASQLSFTLPAHAPGAVTVAVLNPDGQTGSASFTVSAANPALTSIDKDMVDLAGGDTLAFIGTALSGCVLQTSPDNATWTDTTGGTATATTLTGTVAAAAAGTLYVRARTSGGGTFSNVAVIESWAPQQEAVCTGVHDSKHTPYNATSGVWAPRFLAPNISSNPFGSTSPMLAANAGAPVYNGAQYLAGSALASSLLSIFDGAIACVVTPTNETNPEQATNIAYANKQIWSKQSSGPLGLWNATDGSNRWFGFHVYDSNPGNSYQVVRKNVASLLNNAHAVVCQYRANSYIRLSVDGSDPATASTAVTGHPLGYDGAFNIGADYSNVAQATGIMRAFATFNGEPSSSFATKWNRWAIARGFRTGAGVPVTPHMLGTIDWDVTDTMGGDTLTLKGVDLASITAVQFSRDGGATWVAGSLGVLTATTAKVVTPAMAAATLGLVRVVGPNGTSNAIQLEFWAPPDDAACSLLFDAKHTAYNATTGDWIPRYRLGNGTPDGYLTNIASGAKHPSDGAGGIALDGNGAGEIGLKGMGTNYNGTISAYLSPSNSAGQQPGGLFTVHRSFTSYGTNFAAYSGAPYIAPAVIGTLDSSSGTNGLGNAVIDGVHCALAHAYGAAGYKVPTPIPVETTQLHAYVSRFTSFPNLGGQLDLSLDGGVIPSSGKLTSVVEGAGLHGFTSSGYANGLTVGDNYASGAPGNQIFAGSVKVIGACKSPPPNSFVTKFQKWKMSRYGMAA